MGLIEVFLIGIGLSMDAACVSMSNGMCYKLKVRVVIFIGLVFGFFQGLMPIIGYYCGSFFSRQISQFDHWIALVLLGSIGAKMLIDGIKHKSDPECQLKFTMKLLAIQAIATSIDALAVGISFAAIESVNIYVAAGIIAFTTFALSVIAVYVGKKIGTRLSQYAEIFGGTILIIIGIKIFLEHMM